ncbi:MAG: prepilin-type N-terminal cleavage/methylation protein [Schlesneria sp.]|nr:prepilin-type N-terminal cleavage/methylation protein [Schlesneria sp.]
MRSPACPDNGHGALKPKDSTAELKQIGLGLHNYHDKFAAFPFGGSSINGGVIFPAWQTQLLPFVEQEALYCRLDHEDVASQGTVRATLAQRKISDLDRVER